MINGNPDQDSMTSPYGRALISHQQQSLSLHMNLSYNLQKKKKNYQSLLWQGIALQKDTKQMHFSPV